MNKKRICSSTSTVNKEACIICQSSEGTLHIVAFESTGEKMPDVAKKTCRFFIAFMLKHHSKFFRHYSKKCSIPFDMLGLCKKKGSARFN